MGLLGHFILRIAVGINRTVELFKCHQCRDELVVCVEETAKPLLRFHVVDLRERAETGRLAS